MITNSGVPSVKMARASPELKASLFNKAIWKWMGNLISLGNKRPLRMNDLYDLNDKDTASYCEQRWEKCWEAEKTRKIWRVVFRFLGKDYFFLSFLRSFWAAMLILQVYVIKTLVQRANKQTRFHWSDMLLILAMFFCPICQSLSQIHMYFQSYRDGLRVRTAVSTAVFKKMLDMKMAAFGACSGGLMLNVFTNDMQKLADAISLFPYVMMFGLNLVIISALLVKEVGISAIAGITIVSVAQAIQMKLGKCVGKSRKRTIPITDSRIDFMSEVLTGIRVAKFNGWIPALFERIAALRVFELGWIRRASYLRALMSAFRDSTIPLACLTTFGVYVVLHGKLDAATAFTALSLYSVLGRDLIPLFAGIPQCCEGFVAIERLQALLGSTKEDERMSEARGCNKEDTEGVLIRASGCAFTWDISSTSPILNGIDLEVKKGKKIAITGQIGSGKTSLLLALLREMKMLKGSLSVGAEIAYSPQQPWIVNDTLLNNILFGEALNPCRYNNVVSACALDHDISKLVDGSNTEIGERGVNLSGGQRARISLARACYSTAPIVLLDDPFSALDVGTIRHLIQYVFGEILKDRTVIATTHSTMCLKAFDEVYLMTDHTIRPLSLNELPYDSEGVSGISRSQSLGSHKCNSSGLLVKEEITAVGLASFLEYMQMAGCILSVAVAVLYLPGQAVFLFLDYWLRIWTDAKLKLPNHIYVLGYGALAICTAVLSATRATVFYNAAITAAMNMHKRMTRQVLRSPPLFFEQNPAGRILNRFSKDQAVADEIIPVLSQQSLEYLAASIGGLVIIAVLMPWFLLAIPPFVAALVYFRQRYAAVSNALKRLEGVSRSPVYAYFTETMQGVVSVRAYGAQSRFHDQFLRLLDTNQKASILSTHANRWLACRLDFLATVCIVIVAFFVVFLRHSISPGLAGILLVQCFKLTDLLQYATRLTADVENSFTSIERIQEYCHLPTEAESSSQPGTIVDDWPQTGSVEFFNYSLAYREDLPPVLHGISFKVEGSEKIGILGRTGSGKSSLVAAIFRMVENKSCSGSIFVDGVDIKTVGLDDLRQRLSIIPQEPFLFRGSVRFNLDPFGKHEDSEIYEALERSQLLGKIKCLNGGLDGIVADNADNFSIGERQLMCLARSLLRRSKVLILDEATASVDEQTEQTLQATVKSVVQACTVMTIAHRINTVIDSDRILVMDGGRIAEFDTPINLIKTPDGLFATMVSLSGKEVADQLVKVAEKRA